MVRFWRAVGRTIKATVIFLCGAMEMIVRRPKTREQRAQWLHQFCARTMRAMDIAVRVEGTFPDRGVVVSNHMGYLDIMALAAQHECVFVSKSELANVPLLGWMTTMAGTVYVDRGRGGSALRARSGLHSVANAGLPIVIFPEGTTSDGSTVLKFRGGALAQAMDAGISVTAVCISYRLTEDNGPNVTIENDVCFWGDDADLFKHIFGLLALRGIEVNLRIANQPIAFSSTALHRRQIAEEARAAVMELGGVRDAVASS